ncbi:MAG: polynucleotide adenylyltransferase PcnB [Syntrophobacterales bacterium]
MQPTIISRDKHTVSRKQMSEEVLKVLYRLHRTGHLAYLCGGGVRDLLLKRDIDDFDVATDAEPRKVKHVFGNCRLVGRRFRIAHIMFKGGRIIEVSTFRKEGEEEAEENSDSLLIKRDNTYGSPAEDAFRRDFTINALYYNVADFTIIDYVGGRKDLKARLIRCIGDPDIRFQEDPIRILRGIRLAAILDFQVEESTWEAMKRQRHHIQECAVSRIREELMKILRRGSTHKAFELLARASVLQLLFPKLEKCKLSSHEGKPSFANPGWQHLSVLDNLRSQGAVFTDSLLLAALTASPVLTRLEELPPGHDVGKWLNLYLEDNFKPLAIPRRVRTQVHLLLLALRYMLAPKRKKRRRSLRRSALFTDALKLLEIHCLATNQHWPAFKHWQRTQRQRGVSRKQSRSRVRNVGRIR